MNKLIKDQFGVIHTLPLLVIVAAVGIISYLLISSTAPFKGGLFGTLNPRPASNAQMMMTIQDFCKFYTAPGTNAAFCDTFDMAHPGGRGGDLDETRWDFSRVFQSIQPSQGRFDEVKAATAMRCRISTPGVLPDNDSFFCGTDQSTPEANHWMTAMNDDGAYNVLSAMIRQPFDFTNRTGIIAFDVDAIGIGHVWWPEIWITQDPEPNPYQGSPGSNAMPKNGIGLDFESPGCSQGAADQFSQPGTLYLVKNYVQNDFNGTNGVQEPGGCYSVEMDRANHIEIRLSQNRIEIWASDKTTNGTDFPNFKLRKYMDNINLPFTVGYIHIQHGQYNAGKEDFDQNHTFHWHGIGFDGPIKATPRSYDVPDSMIGKTSTSVNVGYPLKGVNDGNQNPTFTLQNINLAGVTSARLNLNVWNINTPDTLLYRFNSGTWRTFPNPYADYTTGARTYSVPLILSDLISGNNTLEIKSSYPYTAIIANVGLELFPGDMLSLVSNHILTGNQMPDESMMPSSMPTAMPSGVPTNAPTPSPTSVPTATTVPQGVPSTPVVTTPSCINPGYNGSGVVVSWNTVSPAVMFADISTDSNFSAYWNKGPSAGVTSMTGPAGFGAFQGATGALTLNPNTSYFVRLFNNGPANNGHSSTTSFTIPACSQATPTPTPKPTVAPTPVPTPTPIPQGSVITVTAGGQAGVFNGQTVRPNMILQINGVNKQTWNGVGSNGQTGSFLTFTYNSPTKVTHDQVRVRFTNDQYNGSTGQDVNLWVQKINIDGTNFPSNAPSVFSNGVWTPSTGCSGGNKQSIELSCNGFFQY